jgi:hypothetical protein
LSIAALAALAVVSRTLPVAAVAEQAPRDGRFFSAHDPGDDQPFVRGAQTDFTKPALREQRQQHPAKSPFSKRHDHAAAFAETARVLSAAFPAARGRRQAPDFLLRASARCPRGPPAV